MVKNKQDALEQNRITVAIAILALVVALYGFNITSTDAWSVTRGFMILPGILSLIYLVIVGSNLKYSNQNWIGFFRASEKVKRFIYDSMINVFWYGVFITLAFLIALIFGWDGVAVKGKFYYGLLVAFVINLILVVFGAYSERPKSTKKKSDTNNLNQ